MCRAGAPWRGLPAVGLALRGAGDVVSARPRGRLQPFRPVGLVLVGREPRVASDLPADRRGVAAGHQTDPADAVAVADLDPDGLASLFRQARTCSSHRCDCLCSMVLRPVERLVFSPKER